ncbi:hypothetical protein DFAR_330020 [Desulfarculales bacterium]
MLMDLYRHLDPRLVGMTLRDAPNDLPMLAVVDLPVLVLRPGGGYASMELLGLRWQPLPGLVGFNQAVLEALE